MTVYSITLEEGHPGVGVNNWFEALDISTFGLHAVKDDGSEDLEIAGSFGTENARFRESGFDRSDGQQFIYSLLIIPVGGLYITTLWCMEVPIVLVLII